MTDEPSTATLRRLLDELEARWSTHFAFPSVLLLDWFLQGYSQLRDDLDLANHRLGRELRSRTGVKGGLCLNALGILALEHATEAEAYAVAIRELRRTLVTLEARLSEPVENPWPPTAPDFEFVLSVVRKMADPGAWQPTPYMLRAYLAGIARGTLDRGFDTSDIPRELARMEEYLRKLWRSSAAWDTILFVTNGYSTEGAVLFLREYEKAKRAGAG